MKCPFIFSYANILLHERPDIYSQTFSQVIIEINIFDFDDTLNTSAKIIILL